MMIFTEWKGCSNEQTSKPSEESFFDTAARTTLSWSTPWAAIRPAYQEELRENNERTLQNRATVSRRTAFVGTVTVMKILTEQLQDTQVTTAEITDTSFNSQLGLTTSEQEKLLVQIGMTNETHTHLPRQACGANLG